MHKMYQWEENECVELRSNIGSIPMFFTWGKENQVENTHEFEEGVHISICVCLGLEEYRI